MVMLKNKLTKNNKNKRKLKENSIYGSSFQNKPVFGRNLKYIEKEKDFNQAVSDFLNFVEWNGLKMKDKGVEFAARKNNIDPLLFKKYLIDKNLYDVQLGYRALRENNHYDNENFDLGQFCQNNDPAFFDYRKKLEIEKGVEIKDDNLNKEFYFDDKNREHKVLCDISLWCFKKLKDDICECDLSECFKTAYLFIINNQNKIYEIFGKTLNDEDKKLVLVILLKLVSLFFEEKNVEHFFDKKNRNVSEKDLINFSLENGISLTESVELLKNKMKKKREKKILHERAPKNPKAERFIRKSKRYFREKYGKDWKRILYATAWKKFSEEENC